MAHYRQILRYVFAVTVILLVIGFEVTTARGGRGGGGRGGARGGSRGGSRGSRSGYRSSGVRSGSVAWKAAVVAGVYYGSRRYSTRRRYYNNQAPQICQNYQTRADQTVYGKFICPLGEQPDDYDYCCGESGRQRCCRFADDPGRIAGLVIGILFSFVVIGLIIYCCCKHQKKKQKRFDSVNKRHNKSDCSTAPANTQIPLQDTGHFPMKPAVPPSTAYPNGAGTYPSAGYPSGGQTGAPGYPPAGAPPYPDAAPPSYDASTGLPYSGNPTGYAAPYPPQGPSPYPPQGPSPYPGPGFAPGPTGYDQGQTVPPMPGSLPGSLPYSPNPVGFVDPAAPNYLDPSGKGYSGQPQPPPY